MTISQIPLTELRADLAESMMDMRLCRVALRGGILSTPIVGDIRARLRGNANVVRTILAEVERRILAGELTNNAKGILIAAVQETA